MSEVLQELTASPVTRDLRVFKVYQAPWDFLELKDPLVHQERKALLVKLALLVHEETPVRTVLRDPLVNLVPQAPLVSVVLPALQAHEVSKVFLVLPAEMVQLVRMAKLVCKVLEVFPAVPVYEAPEASLESEELKVHPEKLALEENLDNLDLTVLQVLLVQPARKVMLVHLVLSVFLVVVVPPVCLVRREREDLWVLQVLKVLLVVRVTKVLRVSWVHPVPRENQQKRETPVLPVHLERLVQMESWENEDLRVHKVFKASPVPSVPLVSLDPRDSAVFLDRKELKETVAPLVSPVHLETRVSPVSTALKDSVVNPDNEANLVSWVPLDDLALLEPLEVKEKLVPLVVVVPQVSRVLLEILVVLVFQDHQVNLVLPDPKVLRANLVLRADSVQ